jgi:hypothetical protein
VNRRTFALLATLIAACRFEPGPFIGDDAGDGGISDGRGDVIPDAGACQTVGASCVGDTLRTCSAIGQPPQEQACGWGCAVSGSNAACSQVAPAGGWDMQSTGDTTDFANLLAITIPDNAVFNSDDGSISAANGTGMFRAAGTGVIAGIDFELRPIANTNPSRTAGVFRFKKLTVSSVRLTGLNSIVLVAGEGMSISGVIDGVPACEFGDVRTPGPGGYAGGDNNVDGLPTPAPSAGGGLHGNNDDIGGGGGGYGSFGGNGGSNNNSGGFPRGASTITPLLGGSGGGGGDSHSNSGRGGGGGAAIHLLANGPITIVSGGGINAGACGGRAGTGSNDGGGGGGAGGAILIEAPTVSVGGTLAVNGGGGGGGNTGANTVGQKGQLSRTSATGGPAGNGSAGGIGGAGALVVGAFAFGSGGGGGSVGRIRINTRTGTVDRANATLSPGPADAFTTYSEAGATFR